MFYSLLVYLTIHTCYGHVPKNSTHFFTTGHSEVNLDSKPIFKIETVTSRGHSVSTGNPSSTTAKKDGGSDVVFVPNERRVEDGYQTRRRSDDNNILYNHQTVKTLGDIIQKQDVKSLGDVMLNKKTVVATEAPEQAVLFISGKNNDEDINKERKSEKKGKKEKRVKEKQSKVAEEYDCKHLNCNNTLQSVCGVKIENGKQKYRLFLNICFFRKVNCAFTYELNRYTEVSHVRCKNVGSHVSQKPFVSRSFKSADKKIVQAVNYEVRRFGSRRSLNMGLDGRLCTHHCPVTCPEDYAPECAVSNTGQHRVFVNHCKIDYNSCFYNVVWHRRPLSECVGGRKADMQQNRAFIGWMQRVGIVDGRGKLVLS